ncbi:MAG: hypothetical protein ACK5US_01005, partial [Lysobacteraceae bacterium]
MTVAPRGLREALIAPLLRAVLRWTVKPRFAPEVPIAAQRARLQRFIPLNRLPKGTGVEAAIHGG